ncbi:MAG TPA: biotin/lipoyl-containing protein, partial [Stellaceae bacterium]|nr:biotin/lipoyl-containing protein [Stellaceae bacterium]
MSEFRMPALGADMEAGTLVEWLVRAGDQVKSGEVIAVVETQKGAIEVEIFETGRIAEILVPVGKTVPVGAVLAHIETAVTAVPLRERPVAPVVRPASPPAAPSPLPPAPARYVAPTPEARTKVTPAARRRAAELGLDPASLQGTGIDGAVTLADVEAAPLPRARPKAARRVGFDPAEMRKAIAAAMGRSKR